jgi:hypothetical protein
MTAPVTFNTYTRIIRLAYKDAGLIQDGDEPNGEQYADGLVRISDMINFWQTQGLKLWLWEDLPIPLVAGTGTYTIGPSGSVNMTKPMRAFQAYYLDSTDIRRPLVVLSWEEYLRLSQVTQTGELNSYFIDKQQTTLNVSFWLVPDATAALGTAHLLIQQQATNPVSLTDSLGFPVEWYLAVRWGLADELATGQPQSIMDRCERKATFFRQALEDWDVEDAPTMFAPDQRNTMYGNSFR